MVDLADHERGCLVLGRGGPGWQRAPAPSSRSRLEPDSPDREAEAAGEQHGDGGRHVVPDADHRVEARIVVGDEVEHGITAAGGKRRPEGVGDRGHRGGASQDQRGPPHRCDNLPVGIHGWERPPGGGWHGRAHASPPRCRSRHPERGGRSLLRPKAPKRRRRSGGRAATVRQPAT